MAAPAYLLEQILQLPQRDRLELVEDVLVASIDAQSTDEDPILSDEERARLDAALDESDRDVAAGRVRPIEELLRRLRATT